MKNRNLLKQQDSLTSRTAIEAEILFAVCVIEKQALTGGKSLAREDKCSKKIGAVLVQQAYRRSFEASAVLNFVFFVMLKNKIEQSAKRNSLLKKPTDRTFENRWSRYKELGKKVPQAYRVYVEDTFLPCDAGDARIFSKEETGLYYYGARYLDPKYSRWLSGDPAVSDYIPKAPIDDEAKKHNENLPGMGGVYNTVNLHVYHYAGYSQRSFELYNPVKYIDPDGKQTKGPDLNLFRKDSAHYRAALKLPNTFDRTFVIAGHGNVNGVFDHRDDPPGVHRLVNKTSAKYLAIMITNNKMFNIKKRSNNGKTSIIMLYACNTGFTDADKKIYAQELANELANILNDDVIVKTPAGLLVLDNRKEFFKVENNKKPMIGYDAFIKFIGRPNKEIQE